MFTGGLLIVVTADPVVQRWIGTPTTRADKKPGFFPLLAPTECTVPYIVYQQISGDPIESYQGINRTQFAHFRFFCNASDYPTAKRVAAALKNCLNSFLGPMGDNDNCSLLNAKFVKDFDDLEEVLHGTLYKAVVDFEFVWNDGATFS